MNNMDDFKINVISGIDEEIIDRNTVARIRLTENPKLSYKKKKIGAIAILAATFILIVGGVFMALLPQNQVPVYEGMTVSGSNPMLGSENIPSQNAQTVPLSSGNNGNHYGHYKGDHVKDDEDIDQDNPYGDTNNNINDVVESGISGEPTENIYYANPGEDVFVTVHVNNPSGYEILSFTLNGRKYSNYMFEHGSDLENLILKVNVGDAQGIKEYTIDQIKYVDGTEIKDVKMEGDKTVRVGIRTDKQPTVTVSEFLSTFNSISFKATITDELGLIEKSNGIIQAVLFDGSKIVASKDISVGSNEISFDNLDMNTLYQCGIVCTYDKLNGEGVSAYVVESNAMYTESPLLFDNISITSKDINFGYNWHNSIIEKNIISVAIYEGDTKVSDLSSDATSVNGLKSNTNYRIVTEYTFNGNTESISLSFKTNEFNKPTLEFSNPKNTGKTFSFDILFTDTDNIGEITSIKLYDGDNEFAVANIDSSVSFTIPSARTEYIAKISYEYDLNDGRGMQTEEVILSSWIPSKGLVEVAGIITGIGTCQDEILFLNKSVLGSAFRDNYSIKEVYFLDGAKNINNYAFDGCISLEYVHLNEGLNAIWEGAFSNCLSLESIDIPSSVTTIEYRAFSSCKNLRNINFKEDSKLTTIGIAAFNDCYSLESFTVPKGITFIEQEAFCGCISLTDIILHDGITQLNYGAFTNCKSLKYITLPNSLKVVGEYAFSSCDSLKEIVIPDSVTAIKEGAFQVCSSLTKVVIPDSVAIIGANTFYACEALSIFYEGNAIPSLWDPSWCFNNVMIVTNATKISFTFEENGGNEIEDVTDYLITHIPVPRRDGYYFLGWYDNPELDGSPVNFPYRSEEKTVLYAKWVEENNFTSSSSMSIYTDSAIYLNYSVGQYEFNSANIKQVYIGPDVTSIGKGAFLFCNELVSVIFVSPSTPEIGDYAIYDNPLGRGLVYVYVPEESFDYFASYDNETWQELIVKSGRLIAY